MLNLKKEVVEIIRLDQHSLKILTESLFFKLFQIHHLRIDTGSDKFLKWLRKLPETSKDITKLSSRDIEIKNIYGPNDDWINDYNIVVPKKI